MSEKVKVLDTKYNQYIDIPKQHYNELIKFKSHRKRYIAVATNTKTLVVPNETISTESTENNLEGEDKPRRTRKTIDNSTI